MTKWRGFGIAVLVVAVLAAGTAAYRLEPHGNAPIAAPPAPPVSAPPSLAGNLATSPAPAAAPDSGPVHFTRLALDTAGEAPEACLFFSRPLSTDVTVHFEDYVRVDPAAKVALRAKGNQLCIGGLGYQSHYTVTIAQGLPAQNAPASIAPETVAVSFGEVPASVDFASAGFILSRAEAHGLPIATVNLSRVKVTVSRVGDRILARTALGSGYGDDGDYDPATGAFSSDVAAPVWSGELAIKNQLNARVVTDFPLAQVLTPRRPGAYVINIAGVKQAKGVGNSAKTLEYVGATRRWIFDTDLMLTSLSGADGLHVFVRSLNTARPVAGATVTLLATDNDVLAEIKTGEDGQAVFGQGLTAGAGALSPHMLMAYLDDDFTAMELTRASLDLSAHDVTGREPPGAVDAFLYTDRGIYRPGETIDAAGLIRDSTGHALNPTPIALVLKRPDGVEAGHWRLTPNEAGGIFQPVTLSANAPRGGWTLEASLAGDSKVIGTLDIQVQDFVPQRLKVELKAAAPVLDTQQGGSVAVNARYLFGAPASGLAVQANLTFAPDPDPVSQPGWSFGLVNDTLQSAPQDLTIPATDDQGLATIAIDPAKIAFPTTSVPYTAQLSVSVVEPGGRTTDTDITLKVHAHDRLIGLRMGTTDAPASLDNPQAVPSRIEVAAFGADGARIAAHGLSYKLIEIITDYNYYEQHGEWKYGSFTRERSVALGSLDVTADTPAAIDTPPLEWGAYRLEVSSSDGAQPASIAFYAGWQDAEGDNPAPETIGMAVDGKVKPGAVAHIRITPPFAGEALVSIVGDRVYQTRVLSIPAAGATVDVTADAAWGPGAYIVASLYRPQHQAVGHAPVRAVGVAWVPLDLAARTLTVSMAPPAVARPQTRVELPVTVTGATSTEPVYVTVAAVDEGLLQLTKFASPDPIGHYFGKRRLAIDIRDDYAHLIDGNEGEAGDIRQGGDAGGGAGLAVVPTKSVALFSGPIKLDATGHATIAFEMPDFAGGLRLMAVAYGTSSMGEASAMMPLRDKVVAEISLPRFLAPQDTGTMTLLLNNVDGLPGRYHLHIAGSGALVAAPVDQDIDLATAGQLIRTYPVSGGAPGIGQVALTLSGPGQLHLQRSWPIQIRTPHFPLTLSTVAMQAPGENFTLDAALAKPFVASTLKLSVDFSTLRGIDLPGLIAALNRYPYGCSEQLVSGALPLLYLEQLKLQVGDDTPETQHLKVQAAINTLLEREDSDGSFGLWQLGDQQATPYLGAYITDFLYRAKTQGYAVPDEALNRAYAGISNFDDNANWRTDVFWKPEGYDKQATILAGQAYAAYDLARAGKADIGQLRYLADTFLGRLEPVGKAQLAAALSLMGDTVRAHRAFDLAEQQILQPPPRWRWFGDVYRTPLRDTAILLTLAAELGQDDRVAQLTSLLEGQDTRTDTLDTQEQAWLSVAAATLLTKGGNLAISVNHAQPTPTPPPLTLHPDVAAIKTGYTVQNQGHAAVFRAVTLYGVPNDAPPAMQNVAHITKSITTMSGDPVDLAHLKQNDRIVVHLSGNIDDAAYHQMILVDMLPAGWEIESVVANSDDPNAGFTWLGKISDTKSMQKRDDRFFAALDLDGVMWANRTRGADDDDPSRFNLAYVVRCVTPGKFVLPGAVLQDMYRAPVMARSAVNATTIAGAQ